MINLHTNVIDFTIRNRAINQSIDQSINKYVNRSIDQSVHRPIDQPINQSQLVIVQSIDMI